jgi:hypothetical protein
MERSLDRSGRSHAARLARYSTVSTSLALLSDRRLGELMDQAPLIGTGIGGAAVRLEVEGTPVFAKRVPLTDLERRPEHVMSTANLFQLPTFTQYGVGSAGGGVWRELAAHTMTTNWVLAKHHEAFPLMYHWRVLPAPPPRAPTPEERADLARTVAYWHGSSAVRERLEAIAQSSASVVLFLEYVPQTLHEWLTTQVASGDDAVESACAMVERSLRTDVSFMNSNGLLHLDAHFQNILTDGQRLYLADLGLATSPRFELSDAELRFLEANRSHDGCYAVTRLVNWLVTALSGAVDPANPAGPVDRNEYLRRRRRSPERSGGGRGGHQAVRADRRRHERLLLEAPPPRQNHPVPGRGAPEGLRRNRVRAGSVISPTTRPRNRPPRRLRPDGRRAASPPALAHEVVVTEGGPRPLGELGAVAVRWEHRRARRSCHPRAIGSGRERYAADSHGQFEKAGGLAGRS